MGYLRGMVTQITNSSGSTTIAIAGAVTVYSKSFVLKTGQSFGFYCKATSSGTVSLRIQLEESPIAPTTEGSSDTTYVVGDGVSDIYSNLADTIAHIKTLTPVPMKHARLKITGGASNDASTTLDARIFIQEIF